MKSTFTDHYNGNRQPFGLYTHPIHLSTTYPGVNPSNSTINMINQFLDWAQEQQNGGLLFSYAAYADLPQCGSSRASSSWPGS